MARRKKKTFDCPLCGQPMDFYAITYRNHPFIDGQTYPAMCFGCAHVPKEYIQKYNDEGDVVEELGPYYTYKYLQTPQELFEAGSCESLLEAKRCVWAVKKRLKAVGTVALKKLKLKRPQHEYDFWEGAEEEAAPKKKAARKKVPRKKKAVKKRATKKKLPPPKYPAES